MCLLFHFEIWLKFATYISDLVVMKTWHKLINLARLKKSQDLNVSLDLGHLAKLYQFKVLISNYDVFEQSVSLRIIWNADSIVSLTVGLAQFSTDETKQPFAASNSLKTKTKFNRNSKEEIDWFHYHYHSLAIFSIHIKRKMFIFNPFFDNSFGHWIKCSISACHNSNSVRSEATFSFSIQYCKIIFVICTN